MFVVWMSLSAMPSALSAASTFVIAAAASARAALTVGRVIVTPRRRSATSGVVTTVPTPVTEIVWGAGVAGSTANVRGGANSGEAIEVARRPAARPAASQRAR